MRAAILIAGIALTACGDAPKPSQTANAMTTVSISLPDEPPSPWTGAGAEVIERNCAACHSPEMIANQPPLGPEKWQATIDKMRGVYKAQIPVQDDARLVAALVATQTRR